MMTGFDRSAGCRWPRPDAEVQIGGFAYSGFFLFSKLRVRADCDRCEAPLEAKHGHMQS